MDMVGQVALEGKSREQIDYDRSFDAGASGAAVAGTLGGGLAAKSALVNLSAQISLVGLTGYGAYQGGTDVVEGINNGNAGQVAFGVGELVLTGVGAREMAKIRPAITAENPAGPASGTAEVAEAAARQVAADASKLTGKARGIAKETAGAAGSEARSMGADVANNAGLGKNPVFFTSATTWTAPSKGTGLQYKVFQQEIDWALEVKGVTNLERAQGGGAPYIMKDGVPRQIQLHHSRQNGQGPLFELSRNVHLETTADNGRRALHPYGSQKHPYYPVNRPLFNIDVGQYWMDRAAGAK